MSSKKQEDQNGKREKRPPFSFVGETLGGISFTTSDFTLHFDGHVGIGVRGEYSLQTNPGSEPEKIEVPEFHPELAKLLRQTVENQSTTKDGTLALQFSSGAVLICYHRIPHDKSYGFYIAD